MRENYTHIVCIIDRSGSMNRIREDAQEGFNAFIEEQKKLPGKCTVTLVQFDDKYETVWENQDIQEVEEYTLLPRGMTALLDAVGSTVNLTGEYLSKMPEEQRPSKVIVAVVTDGQENKSCEFDKAQINEMVTHQTDKYSWEFCFLAANQDAIQTGAGMGIRTSGTMNFDATGKGVRQAFASYSVGTTQYRRGATETMTLPNHANKDTEE